MWGLKERLQKYKRRIQEKVLLHLKVGCAIYDPLEIEYTPGCDYMHEYSPKERVEKGIISILDLRKHKCPKCSKGVLVKIS